jgi:SAM-dependent methyltransferase
VSGFWDDPEIVARFAGREPDLRLRDLVARFAHPPAVRVLDVGCAGGRNTVFLARRGFDVFAVDASAAMVAETRARLAEVTGEEEAVRRVRRLPMDRLDEFPAGAFDLVVALGVHQSAATAEEWRRSLDAVARRLARGGFLLTANFTPRMTAGGKSLEPLGDDVYRGFASGLSVLREAPAEEAALVARGFRAWTPPETVDRETDDGLRSTVNGLYLRV